MSRGCILPFKGSFHLDFGLVQLLPGETQFYKCGGQVGRAGLQELPHRHPVPSRLGTCLLQSHVPGSLGRDTCGVRSRRPQAKSVHRTWSGPSNRSLWTRPTETLVEGVGRSALVS